MPPFLGPIRLVLATCVLGAVAHASPPNIILFLVDDAGVEAFSCYAGDSYGTPNIDRLAAEGVRFTQAHAQPLCTPSRVKLLTGQSNIRNYWRFSVLPKGETTIAHHLQRAGYATGVVGKWQLHAAEQYQWAGAGATPEQAGFDEHCLWQVDKLGSRYHDPTIVVNGEYLEDTAGRYGPDIFADHAIDFMRRHTAANTPFFLFYPNVLVHDPFVPTPDSADPRSKDRQGNFADMVAYLDRIVGRVTDATADLGIADDTIIIFVSDNGTHRSIRSMRHGRQVQGGKNTATDRGTHVPLIVRWPGQVIAGHSCDDLIDLSDIMPTVLEAASVDLTGPIDGRSFLPQLGAEDGSPRDWIHIYCNARPERANFPLHWFVRGHRYKLHRDGRLFDLLDDPDETSPILAPDDTPQSAQARARLEAAFATFPALPQAIEAQLSKTAPQ